MGDSNYGNSLCHDGSMVTVIRSKQTKVGELDIHYLTGGQGYPLVIIHGGGEGAKSWLQNLAELSRHYTVYVPDLPGFGCSQAMGDGSHISDFVEFVKDFSHELGLKRFHLMGHSIGGGIALHYALRFPHEIKSLVLVDSLCLGKEIALWIRFVSSLGSCLVQAALAVLKAVRWLIRIFFTRFEFVAPILPVRIIMGMNMTSFRGQNTVLMNRLSELIMPTLLVWGGKDTIIPASHAYAASELIPRCHLHVFQDCGHSVYKQKVREFSQLLTGFLS